VRCLAAASSALRPVLAGPARPATLLGATRGAIYLKTRGRPGVLAVLSHDAVRLPCGLLLPATSAEVPLVSLVPPPARLAGFSVGDGAVNWTGPDGPVSVRVVREWPPARPARGQVSPAALAAARPVLEPDDRLLADLAGVASDRGAGLVASRLLGHGPGLTPSGDDVLAGFLTGAAAFGLDAAALRRAVAVLAPGRTTALSAALLWHAARGECIDELAALATVLTGAPPGRPAEAVSRLTSVGHTSGQALALGLMLAAQSALVPANRGRAA
jgi:Protein of unknown function (DUF2877)